MVVGVNSSNIHAMIMLSIVLIFSFDQCFMVLGWLGDKVHVYVKNELEAGKTLRIRCKSKNDNLGEHSISFNEIYEWSFRNNLWDSTLFWCHMEWEESSGQKISGSFEIYNGGRDKQRCRRRCEWLVEKRGLYSYNRNTGSWESLFDWPQ